MTCSYVGSRRQWLVPSSHGRAGAPDVTGATYYRLTVYGAPFAVLQAAWERHRDQETEMTEPGLAAAAASAAATGPHARRLATRWMQKLAEETQTVPDPTGRAVDTATNPASDLVDPITDAASDDAPVDLAQDPAEDPGGSADGDGPETVPLGAGVLFVLALLWVAAMMWSIRASLAGNMSDPAVVISSVALALPGVVAATLLAGAAAGLAAANRFTGKAGVPGGTCMRRLWTGAVAGLAVGVVAAGVILFTFGANAAIGVIATTVGVSALLAGVAAALPGTPLAAAIAATLSVFISGALLNLFQSPLKSLLGAGETVASQTEAADRFLLVSSFITGLVAGVVAYLFLRRREPGRRWPWYLLAGATPGLLSLIGEIITQVGGASLFRIVGGFSDTDHAVMDYLSGARVVSGLVVAFAGGISAMMLVGRTLRRPDDIVEDGEEEDEPSAEPQLGQ